MENDTTADRQRKYKLSNQSRGLKRVGVIVPIAKAPRIIFIAKKMRENYKTNKKETNNEKLIT